MQVGAELAVGRGDAVEVVLRELHRGDDPGLADLVGAWTEGRSDLDAAQLVEVAADLFEQVLRRPTG